MMLVSEIQVEIGYCIFRCGACRGHIRDLMYVTRMAVSDFAGWNVGVFTFGQRDIRP